MSRPSQSRALRRATIFTITLLLIEFLDEFVYGAREAVWPLIRSDLGLGYAQIGLLLGAPKRPLDTLPRPSIIPAPRTHEAVSWHATKYIQTRRLPVPLGSPRRKSPGDRDGKSKVVFCRRGPAPSFSFPSPLRAC